MSVNHGNKIEFSCANYAVFAQAVTYVLTMVQLDSMAHLTADETLDDCSQLSWQSPEFTSNNNGAVNSGNIH